MQRFSEVMDRVRGPASTAEVTTQGGALGLHRHPPLRQPLPAATDRNLFRLYGHPPVVQSRHGFPSSQSSQSQSVIMRGLQ